MSKTYTGTQVYQRIADSIEFMEKRVGSLEKQLQQVDLLTTAVEEKITDGFKDLSSAYLKGDDLEDSQVRTDISGYTGLDLSYVVDEFRKKEDKTRERITELEGSRLYLMRDSTQVAQKNPLQFTDERINAIAAIEEHPGYKGAEGLEGLKDSGFIEGKHRKGFFGFRNRRLEKLAYLTAQELGYATCEEMEYGQGNSFENLEEKAGRREQRNSISLLLLHPELSVLEVKAKVDALLHDHRQLHQEIGAIKESRHEYAIEELAKHFAVIRLENIKDGNNDEVKSYILILTDLLGQKENYKNEKVSIAKEQSGHTRQISELSATLAKFPGLKDSDERIEASKVDKLFSGESLESSSIKEIDDLIRRDFPRAVAYKDFTHTRRSASQASKAEYNSVVQRAGGVGKWTEWRKV